MWMWPLGYGLVVGMAVLGELLSSISLKVFSNLSGSRSLWGYFRGGFAPS